MSPPPDGPDAPPSSAQNSRVIAVAILFSRVAGLVREIVFGSLFGLSEHADALRSAQRLPNVLQNLLGDGTLSASFIPAYSQLLAQGRREEAGRLAGAVFGLLAAVAGVAALLGVVLAPIGVTLLLPGFTGEKRDLTIALVRVLFPTTGVLALSAWALGILNSHRSFFLPYVAPVLSNVAIVTAMCVGYYGLPSDARTLALVTGWGFLAGGLLQFGVQIPKVMQLAPGLRPSLDLRSEPVREVLRNAVPAVLSRGVVQVSGYFDQFLASALATSAVSSVGQANVLYTLPLSLFAMSVAAAELPELSRDREQAVEVLRDRTTAAVERVAFYVVPSCAAFLSIGDSLIGALFQRAAFGPDHTRLLWLVLSGYAVGLVATGTSRLYSSAFFALRDTKTPARTALVRVIVSGILAFGLMTQLEPLNFHQYSVALPAGPLQHLRVGEFRLGAVGLTLGTGIAAWVEWALLRRALSARLGPVGGRGGVWLRLFVSAASASAVGLAAKTWLPPMHPFLDGVLVCGAFGVTYLAVAAGLGLGEASTLVRRVLRRR